MRRILALIAVAGLITSFGWPASAGSFDGLIIGAEIVEANDTDVYKFSFYAGSPAIVAISGDGDTRLDLRVYDGYGRLVASDVGPGDDKRVQWYPTQSGYFFIKVRNLGPVYNNY